MAEFVFRGKKVYYEIHGDHGKPLMLLNGIMMSTNSWKPFVRSFSADNILILVDFLDQGRSERMGNDEPYTHEIQIELTAALIDRLGFGKVNIMGISYGGEVALGLAVTHPDKIDRLVLFNTASRTSSWLREIGHSWNAAAETGDGRLYYLTTIPVIYSTEFYESHAEWMKVREKTLVPYFSQKSVLEALIRLTNSSETYNVTERLGEIKHPTLIVSADSDIITPLIEQKILHEGIANSKHVIMKESGHASMYEQPLVFAALVLGFVNSADCEFAI